MIGEHELRLLFEDGTIDDVAFADDEWHSVFAPLRDPELSAAMTGDQPVGQRSPATGCWVGRARRASGSC